MVKLMFIVITLVILCVNKYQNDDIIFIFNIFWEKKQATSYLYLKYIYGLQSNLISNIHWKTHWYSCMFTWNKNSTLSCKNLVIPIIEWARANTEQKSLSQSNLYTASSLVAHLDTELFVNVLHYSSKFTAKRWSLFIFYQDKEKWMLECTLMKAKESKVSRNFHFYALW